MFRAWVILCKQITSSNFVRYDTIIMQAFGAIENGETPSMILDEEAETGIVRSRRNREVLKFSVIMDRVD